MTTKQVVPALSPEALLGKSKTYTARALAAKDAKDLGEYQLWASLALELLCKWALAEVIAVLSPIPKVSLFLQRLGYLLEQTFARSRQRQCSSG
jgi:hypothetical protein